MDASATWGAMGETTAEQLQADEFAAVATAHRTQVYRLLLASSRDPELADTLTQECFLKAQRNWRGFRGEASALTWLMRIAINLLKDHWRSHRFQFWRSVELNAVDAGEAGEWLPSGERSIEQRLLARERLAGLWQVVGDLSERQRTVFLLRYVEEMEIGEIAEATGLREGTVKAHLSRALVRVRTQAGETRR